VPRIEQRIDTYTRRPYAPDVVRVLSADEAEARADELAEVLLDVVAGGASVSFLAGLSAEDARGFFERMAGEVRAGRRLLLAAFAGPRLMGTVQLMLDTPPNQPHRAELAKLLVHRDGRRRGIATSLLHAVEGEARRRGRTLLTLDTMAGHAADHLYQRLGYVRVGEIPEYALFPEGGVPGPTAIFYKRL
jgi:ribosomal protein S18 acetylase RimI-like enzyme